MSREQWGHGFHTGMNKARQRRTSEDPFPVGLYFLAPDYLGPGKPQIGMVRSKMADAYLVRFSDDLGQVRPVQFADMEKWRWYETREAAIEAWFDALNLPEYERKAICFMEGIEYWG